VVPDLVIEIDSPGRRPRVEMECIRSYLDAGVRLVWILHTASRSATSYHAQGRPQLNSEMEVLDGGDVLPGLRVPLTQVFDRIPSGL